MQKFWRIVPMVKRVARAIKDIGYYDPIFIYAHSDADGIASASIVSRILYILDKPFVIRFIKQIREDILGEIIAEQTPFYAIFVDLGSGHLKTLKKVMRRACTVIIVDHHAVEDVSSFRFKLYHLNFRLVGLDGNSEFSSSTVAYTLARAYYRAEPKILHLSRDAVVGALGDNQDVGDKRSLVGLNKLVFEEGEKADILEHKVDLLLLGRSTKPVFQALADIYVPIIPGISGSPDGAFKALVSIGVLPDDVSATTITWDSLDEDKRRRVFELIVQRIKAGGNVTFEEISRKLLGVVYEHKLMDIKIRDLREIATLLNATARMGRPDVGLSVLYGDEYAMSEAQTLLKQYQYELSVAMRMAGERMEKKDNIIIVDGREFLKEGLTSTVASLLARNYESASLIIVLARSDQGLVKVSIRKPRMSRVIAVSSLIQKAITGIRGASGGGHESSGGAYVPEDKIDIFIERLRRSI